MNVLVSSDFILPKCFMYYSNFHKWCSAILLSTSKKWICCICDPIFGTRQREKYDTYIAFSCALPSFYAHEQDDREWLISLRVPTETSASFVRSFRDKTHQRCHRSRESSAPWQSRQISNESFQASEKFCIKSFRDQLFSWPPIWLLIESRFLHCICCLQTICQHQQQIVS